MHRALSQVARFLLLAGLVSFLPAEGRAYINAGFKSRKEYEEWLKKGGPRPGDRVPRGPQTSDDHFGAGYQAQEDGKWDAAIQHFDRAIRLAPTFPEAYLYRGAARWRKKDYPGALADYQEAVKQTERGKLYGRPISSPYLHLAAAYAFCPDKKLRDPAQALAVAERAGAVSGERFVECVEVLAALHAHAGDFEAAIRVQTRAVKRLSPARVLRDVPALRKELEKAAQGRLEQYRQGKAAWDFRRDLTGPAVPLPKGAEQYHIWDRLSPIPTRP